MTENFDILFLGGLFPKEFEEEIIKNSKESIQNAANNLQWEIVRGLDTNLSNPVSILNSLYIGSYPKRYKKIIIPTKKFSHNVNSLDMNIGFFNFTGLKIISKYLSLKPHLKKWACNNNGKTKIIVAYAMTVPFTHSLNYIKKINQNIKTCLIVPDLPDFMRITKKRNILLSLFKIMNNKIIKNDMKYIDSYVLLTEGMKDFLKIASPYVVVEGISTYQQDDVRVLKYPIKTVAYTGGLSVEYGIFDLINAFKKIRIPECQLIICGNANVEIKKKIEKECEEDSRIIYLGLIKREQVHEIQKSATILVNPRKNDHEFVKYSFPSKIMEYMSSGTPLLAYVLDGVPDDYSRYYFHIPNNDTGLYESLKQLLEINEEVLHSMGRNAKIFVAENKNNCVQAKKIVDMFSALK